MEYVSDIKTRPATNMVSANLSDTANLTNGNCRGIYVGVSGNVAVIFVGASTSVTIPSLAAGIIHPMEVSRILSTGTTATGIFVAY